MADSEIPWTDYVWNPMTGCTHVSDGCDHCYAFALHDQRHVAWKRGRWDAAPAQYHQPFSTVQLFPDRLDQPLHWRKPQRVFVASMGDLWHPDVPDEFLDRVFATMAVAREHTFMVLTKRPERMQAYLTTRDLPLRIARAIMLLSWKPRHDTVVSEIVLWGGSGKPGDGYVPVDVTPWPLPNVWLGVTAENQAMADERIPWLLMMPAAKRFASVEPMLGAVDLTEWFGWDGCLPGKICPEHPRLDWAICGGESGPNCRYVNLRWVRALMEQCDAAGIPWYGKQNSGPKAGVPLPGELGARAFPEGAPRG